MTQPDAPRPPDHPDEATAPGLVRTERAPSAQVERLVDEYLAALAGPGSADLAAFERRAGDEPNRRSFVRQALAQELLWRRSRGEAPAFDEFQRRLPEDDRAAFAELVHDAELAQRMLPSGLVPGSVLAERYEIRRELGRGGMGVVLAAFDRELEREVAVKVFNQATNTSSEDWEAILLQESKTLAKLGSRNIVAIHDARRWRENSFIVMDLVRGRDLAEVLRRVRGGTEDGPGRTGAALERAIGAPRDSDRRQLVDRSWFRSVTRIMLEIVRTIELAHERGVVHRDLKPTNVLVVGGGEPILLDFGLSAGRSEVPSDDERGFCCTPSYVPPERARDLSNVVDPRADVYQLGLVFFELLTLEMAFETRTDEALFVLLQRITSGARRTPREVDPAVPRVLEAICEKALETDPAARYQSAREMREDLERACAGAPPRHARIGRVHALALRTAVTARHPITLSLGAAGLAALAWFGLTRDEWVPPELDPFLHTGSGRPALVQSPAALDADRTVVGLRFRGDDPTHLYVFSISGDPDDEDATIRPLLPEPFPSTTPPEDTRPRGIDVAPGEHWIACALVGPAEASEGLLVYVCAEPVPALTRWQQTLAELEQETLAAVPYARGMAIGRDLVQGARGESLGTLSREARLQLFGEVLAGDGDPDAWRVPGVRRHLFRFERSAEAGG